MSYVITVPEMMATAATDLATIGSTLGAAHTQAAAPTLALMPAAADEVSAGVAQLFSSTLRTITHWPWPLVSSTFLPLQFLLA